MTSQLGTTTRMPENWDTARFQARKTGFVCSKKKTGFNGFIIGCIYSAESHAETRTSSYMQQITRTIEFRIILSRVCEGVAGWQLC